MTGEGEPTAALPELRLAEGAGSLDDFAASRKPVVLRGLVASWPAVAAAREGDEQAAAYVARFDGGTAVEAFIGSSSIGGRFFYAPDLAGFNFQKRRGSIRDILNFLVRQKEQQERLAVYIGAAAIPEALPGFEGENPLPLLGGKDAVPRIWIGSDTKVAAHYDLSDNIACVVAGRRRFTLFPPEQVANLYVGPLDHTMAGQPASMVDLENPDFERFPRFHEALEHAFVADLEPGDAIYIPSPWWHQVSALTPFNILVNYWWDDAPADAGSPFEAMAHAILTISNLPQERREAWRSMFDHYVFKRNGEPAEHLPAERRGILGAPTPQLRRMMREFLARVVSRG